MNWDKATTELSKGLDSSQVKERTQSGQKLSYIESWHAIAEANRIFGYGEWTRETLKMELVQSEQKPKSQGTGTNWYIGYIAVVQVTVGGVIRQGTGFGQGIDSDLGRAHESAVKEAESDAMKRALMTFGNPFGLALYDKTKANVIDMDDAKKIQQTQAFSLLSQWKVSKDDWANLCAHLKLKKIGAYDFVIDAGTENVSNREEFEQYIISSLKIASPFTAPSTSGQGAG